MISQTTIQLCDWQANVISQFKLNMALLKSSCTGPQVWKPVTAMLFAWQAAIAASQHLLPLRVKGVFRPQLPWDVGQWSGTFGVL